MKIALIFFIFFFITNCSKPKTVLICGNHVCVNKDEADQYFEENLSIEVKIINKKVRDQVDLVELNLSQSLNGNKEIGLSVKKNKNKKLKILSIDEIAELKKDIKNKKKDKKIAKIPIKKNDNKDIINNSDLKKLNSKSSKYSNKDVNKNQKEVFDVCTILKKCSIDEISKYLLDIGKNKKFPDITKRQ